MERMLFVGGSLHGKVKRLPDGQPTWRIPPSNYISYYRRQVYMLVVVGGQVVPRFFWVMACIDHPDVLVDAIHKAQTADPDWRPDFIERPPE